MIAFDQVCEATEMFTGIVEERGAIAVVTELQQAALVQVRARTVLEDTRPGDSIAVNGVCLTVVEVLPDGFTADVMKETLDRTSLGGARPGMAVNLERAARLDSRIGGHLVQGHVDGTGRIVSISPQARWTVMQVAMPPSVARYVAVKGSIAIDGVSLTVVDVGKVSPDQQEVLFSVSLIPTTLEQTNLGTKCVGDRVNLEVDIVAKYVERLLSTAPPSRGGDPA
jgi:riboflavin synthase